MTFFPGFRTPSLRAPLVAAFAAACGLGVAALHPVPAAGQVAADTGAVVDNPFAGFETHRLANGVKVWYLRLPGAPDVSVSVTVPYGSDQDPEGKEEVAHFLEHVLFSDHAGRTEEEIKDEIEGRGGRRNGLTYPDRTYYYATVAREHGLFAVRWLGRIVEPHAMDPEVVDRNREPVANEIRARPRELPERIWAMLNPEWLRMPGFWEMEFGLETRSGRSWDRYATLYGITPDDLRDFYRRYYTPRAMTLTVVGDLPRDSVLTAARDALGHLEARPAPAGYGPLDDPDRFRRQVTWGFAPNPRYRTLFKLYEPTADELVTLLFARDLLDRRLERRLRYGERKAVYGIGVEVVQRGPAAYLGIHSTVDEEDTEWALEVVEEELDVLRRGRWPADAFEADRRALVEGLRNRYRTPEELNFWVRTQFYRPDTFRDFPDLVSRYEAVTPSELAAFAEGRLVPERRVEWIRRVLPGGPTVAVLLGLLFAVGAVRVTGRLLTTPVDMTGIRYVARIRTPLPFLVALGGLWAGVGLVLLRLALAGVERVMHHRVLPVDSLWVQLPAMALIAAALLAAGVAWLSLVPRKILVFPDHLRIKSLAYRSRIVRPDDVEELALLPGRDVWLGRRLLGTIPLTAGLVGPGLYLATRRGAALYVRARDTAELATELERWRASTLPPDGPPPGRSSPAAPAAAARPGSPGGPGATTDRSGASTPA